MKIPVQTIGALLVLGAMAGCRQPAAVEPTATTGAKPSAPKQPAASTLAECATAHVNEAGVIPILEYHDVLGAEKSMCRSVAHFRADLKRLYAEGYRPASLRDVLDNRINTPLGKSPVVFTFDDARESQYRLLPDGSVDPDCSLGIMEAFAREHPDFPVKATFYILPKSAFGALKEAPAKIKHLVALGCEIGNHTVTHKSLKQMTGPQVVGELGECAALLDALDPGVRIDTIALPMGIAPRDASLLASGIWQGHPYRNRGVLLVGANPAPAPTSAKFNAMRLPRIQACEGPFGIADWLAKMHHGRPARYVSDGDPSAVTVPAALGAQVEAQRLKGAVLRTY